MLFSKKPTIVTHNGHFHPDDVCAVAVLHILLKGRYRLVRTRDREIIESADYVVDVGGVYDPKAKRFDHHQREGAGTRENGVPYAAFGLVWKEYGASVSGSADIAKEIDRAMVAYGDARDNGVETDNPVFADVHPYTFAGFLSSFNPSWNERQDYDAAFKSALGYAVLMLEREIDKAKRREEGNRLSEMAYERAVDKRLIELDGHYPWKDSLMARAEPLFVLYHNKEDGSWRVKGVPVSHFSYDLRKPFPKEWAGLSDEALASITGVPDATFAHNKRFLVVARSREGALALAKKGLEA